MGYDINCGVRLLTTNLSIEEFLKKRMEFLNEVFRNVPSGLGSKGRIKVTKPLLLEVLEKGSKWAVSQGYGNKEDIDRTEEYGCMPKANSNYVSERALQRGMPQLGSLGSGNHFLEVQKISNIFDEKLTKAFGLDKNCVTVMVHCGSRGLGHQVASDYIKLMEQKFGFKDLPDRELINAPINSDLGQKYYGAMSAAVNYAFANRQMIMHWVRESFQNIFGSIKLDLIYDVAHNVAKFEKHKIDNKFKEVCIHRKGATRSFGPNREELPEIYKKTGQPVLIPGSMGTSSYLLIGTNKAEEISFSSTCFGGDTKIITDRGILTMEELYNNFKNGKQFLVPSINEITLELEWKPVLDSMKRKANLIEVSISQSNRSNQSTLRVTPDHNFVTINNFKLTKEEINNIIKENKFLCSIDRIPNLFTSNISPKLAYLVGSLVSDGHFYCNKRQGRITFTQKKVLKKLAFINYVQQCFLDIFNVPLKEYHEKVGGGIINGRQIIGSGTDYVCCQKMPALTLLDIYNNLSSWIISLDIEAICNFLAGLIDGDGTWNEKRKTLQIYTGDEKVVGATLLACLKLGILPYISKQRKSCYIIQLSEKENLVLNYTKRIKGIPKKRKYGQKLFSAKQLFTDLDVRWPYKHKLIRNNLISIEQIKNHLHKYPEFKEDLLKLIGSPIRMQRIKKVKDLGFSDVYNIEVEDNHNYTVLTDMFMPILVKNCHGAGRTESRSAALRQFRGEQIKAILSTKNIEVKTGSLKGLAEEAPSAYKDIDEVAKVSHEVGIGNLVCKVIPLAVIKG